jgi:hypothetical protein
MLSCFSSIELTHSHPLYGEGRPNPKSTGSGLTGTYALVGNNFNPLNRALLSTDGKNSFQSLGFSGIYRGNIWMNLECMGPCIECE